MVLSHTLDQDHLGAVLRRAFTFEIHDEILEFLSVFPREEDEHAASIGKAVGDVVLRGCGLALARRRTAGEFCIGLVGLDLRFCCHRWKYPFAREFRARGKRTGAAISGKTLQKKEVEKMQTFVIVCGTRLQRRE